MQVDAWKVFRHLFPGTSSSCKPNGYFEDSSVIDSWSSAFRSDFFDGKEILDALPVGIVEFPGNFFGTFGGPLFKLDILAFRHG